MKKSLIFILCIALMLTGCGTSNKAIQNGYNEIVANNEEAAEQLKEADAIIESAFEDLKEEENVEKVEINKTNTSNIITLNGGSIDFTGSGAKVSGSTVTITSAGTYMVSGTLTDGSIIVDSAKNDVNIVLNGANIKCNTGSAINVVKASKVTLTVNEGTVNNIEDGSSYVLASGEDEPDSAIFSKADLVINGTGTLNVIANYNDGIKSKDTLTILNGNISVTSVDDGIMGKDMVAVKNGKITVNAGGDGIKATNDEDLSLGYIVIQNGTLNITAGADGIQAETNIVIGGGTFNITTGGGSGNSSSSSQKEGWGNWQTTWSGDEQSAKGLKAKNNITINGGAININSSDDSIHSNNSIVINNGEMTLSSGDDGIHADSTISIINGNIDITKSYEGIESANITINSGNISVKASDDGINVAGGNDSSSMNGRPGQNTFSSTSNNKLTITGGNINVDASGDGLDANGSIYISGGVIKVNGPSNNGNGALDYDSVCEVTGGTLIAIGSTGMAQTPSTSSTVYGFSLTSSQSAGSNIKIKDNSGNVIVEMDATKAFSSIVASSDKFVQGETYSVYINDQKVQDVTISSIVTNLGGSSNGGFGGGERIPGGGGNGMQPPSGGGRR